MRNDVRQSDRDLIASTELKLPATVLLLVALLAVAACASTGDDTDAVGVAADYLAAVAAADSAQLQDLVPASDFERNSDAIQAAVARLRASDYRTAMNASQFGKKAKVHYQVSDLNDRVLYEGDVTAWKVSDDSEGVIRGSIDNGPELVIVVNTSRAQPRVTEVSGVSPSQFFVTWWNR